MFSFEYDNANSNNESSIKLLSSKLLTRFSKDFILSSATFLSADIMHHLFLNKLAKPASGPLYSVPAIGCEAIQLTFLRFKLLTILFTSFLEEIEPLITAYLQVKATDDIKLQFGAAGTAYVGMYDKFWGHRWLAKSFTDQEKILDSADLGVHASGAHADGLVSWGAAVVNGAGYGNPEDDASKAAQARLTVDPLKSGGEMSLPFTVFASKDVYTFEDEEGTTTLVGSVGFDHDVVTVWGEYVTTDDGDINGAGLSATLVGKVKDVANVVVRYDSLSLIHI